MSTNLPPELNQLIAQELALGHYRTEEELLTEAVHLLSQRNALREQIAAGTRQLANGEYTDYDPQAYASVSTILRRVRVLRHSETHKWAWCVSLIWPTSISTPSESTSANTTYAPLTMCSTKSSRRWNDSRTSPNSASDVTTSARTSECLSSNHT